MTKLFLVLAAITGGTAVMMGAFAAHALKARLEPALLATLKTGVDYQFYHALGLMGVALLLRHWPGNGLLIAAGSLLVLGILLFCGSLYGLALLQWRWLGPITPLGGLCFVSAWACILAAALRLPD